jgi:hypothetical protein
MTGVGHTVAVSSIESWTVRHFSLANPKGPGQEDVPALLRRLADHLEERGAIDVQDLVFHAERDDEGEDWPTVTVYFNDVTAES